MPTLLVWGAHDTFQPLPYGQRLAKAMPNAELEVIEEAGHFLPEDTPDRLAQLIIRFVENAVVREKERDMALTLSRRIYSS